MANNVNYQQPEEPKAGTLKGKAEVKKKKASQKVIDFLFSNRLEDMGTFLVQTILGPGLRNLFYNVGVGALGVMFRQNGGYYPNNTNNSQPYWTPPQTNYSGLSTQAYWNQQRPVTIAQGPYVNDYKSVIFTYRDDALTVIDRLANQINKYGRVTVRGFYDAAEVSPPLNNWAIDGTGWHTVQGAHPVMTSDGRWIIEMPPVQNL